MLRPVILASLTAFMGASGLGTMATAWTDPEHEVVLEGPTDWITTPAWSSDFSVMFAGSDDGFARLWDTESGDVIEAFDDGGAAIVAAEMDASAQVAVTATADGRLTLWDVDQGRRLHTLTERGPPQDALDLSRDGRLLLAGSSEDETARLWDVATGAELRAFPDQWVGTESLALSPDGTSAVIAARIGIIRWWDVETGQPVPDMEIRDWAFDVIAFHPSGQAVVGGLDSSGRTELTIWTLSDGDDPVRIALEHYQGPETLEFVLDGTAILCGCSGDVVIVDTDGGTSLFEATDFFVATDIRHDPGRGAFWATRTTFDSDLEFDHVSLARWPLDLTNLSISRIVISP